MTGKTYARYADGRARKSPLARDCVKAFFIGGMICGAGEALRKLCLALGAEEERAGLIVSLVLIVLAAVLTGLGVFDKIARHGGGGTLVPITGFANAVASAALDSKAEGYVTGVGAKIFTVAGPVILYSTAAGTVYGLICWLGGLLR